MPYHHKRVVDVLYERSLEDSANYVEQNMPNALLMWDESTKIEMFKYAVKNIEIDGFVAEFGVHQGYSIEIIAKLLPNKTIWGFDSFTGLDEDWVGWEWQKGSFDMDGMMPKLKSNNITLIGGYFKDSLPDWADSMQEPAAFLNIDCDLYSSTKTVLDTLGPTKIVPGTVILFDEYLGFHTWRNHEFKAWQEFVQKHNLTYEYKAINHMQTLVKVTSPKK